jgi:branched-chain amino acid transport system substrate-binding protein
MRYWLALLLLGGACGVTDAPVRIGLAGPFSDPVGGPMRRAAELAVGEINAAGGINGRPIELVARDDAGDPDSAVRVASDLVAEEVVAVIGHVYSGTTLAAAPIYGTGSDPIPVLTPSSSAPEVVHAGSHVFRLCPTDLEHGAALATWLRRGLGLGRGAVLYLDNAYGRGIRQAFVARFGALGGAILSVDPYLGSEPDVGPYLDRLGQMDAAEFLVIAGNREDAEAILPQVRTRGMTMPVVGGDGLEGIETAGQLAEGMYLTSAYLPTLETPENRRFVAAYRSRYPDAAPPNQPAAATYDAVYLLRDLLRSGRVTRRALLDALVTLGETRPPFQGVTGMLGFDGEGDLARMPVLIGTVQGGIVKPVGRK